MLHDIAPTPKNQETIRILRRVVSLSDSVMTRFLPDSAVLAEGEDISAAFPWAGNLDAHLPQIRAEADSVLEVLDRLPPFGEVAKVGPGVNRDTQWRLYPFILMRRLLPAGVPTPVSRRVVQQIPGVVNGFFSILPPHTSLRAHKGTSRLLVRCHVGLCVPREREKCFFVVDGHRHVWQVGHKLVFDQTFEHYAVNDTVEPRLVLIVDLVRPELPAQVRGLLPAVTYALGLHPHAQATLRSYRRALRSLSGSSAGSAAVV